MRSAGSPHPDRARGKRARQSRDAVPNAAPLPPQRVVASPARFAAGTFGRMLIEGEVAFRLRAPITDAASVTEAVGEWLVTIEIVDPRFADLDATTPLQKLADHGLHGALVVGSGVPLPPRSTGARSSRACAAMARRS